MTRLRIDLICMAVILLIAPAVFATTLPASDPSYVPMTDMVTFNWWTLEAATGGAITAPHLPTAHDPRPAVRIFSNGNTTIPDPAFVPPVKWQDDTANVAKASELGKFNMRQTAALWYGLEWSDDPFTKGGTVADILTTDTVLASIREINPTAYTPIFAFDQNQTPNAGLNDPIPPEWTAAAIPGFTPDPLGRDIWIRGRLMVLPPDMVAALAGADPNTVKSTVEAGILGGSVAVFVLADDVFNDFPDEADPNDTGTGNWAYLPGLYDPANYLTGDPILDPNGDPITGISNNGSAGWGDWGGFFPELDLTTLSGYGMLIELQTFWDNDGQEEVYIIGGLSGEVIPEPLTLIGVLAACGGLGRYMRRRVR